MKMIASGAPWMFSMSLLFYHSIAHRYNHLLIFIHHQPVWQQRPFHDLQSRDELRQLQQSDRSCSNLQPCCFNNVTKGRKKGLDFLKRLIILAMTLMMVMMLVVRTIVMTVGTCQQDCPEEHSWWRCPSHFAAEDPPIKSKWENEKWKWKVKIPITLCCWSSTYQWWSGWEEQLWSQLW